MSVSYAQSADFTCPECGAAFAAEVWLVVDATDRPDVVARACDGALHSVICPNGHAHVVDAPLLLFRPGQDPPLLFSPAESTPAEEDRQQAAGLVRLLRERTGDAWRDEWVARVVPSVVRAILPIVLDVAPDDKQLEASLQGHQRRFGRPPDLLAGDRGCYSPRNEELAKEAGMRRIVLPKTGRISPERQKQEKQRWFRRGMCFGSGSEGRISVLRPSYGLGCCLNHGEDGFGRWVGWGILTANLATISRTAATRQARCP